MTERAREPGQLAFETWRREWNDTAREWRDCPIYSRPIWAAVEAAIRKDERERCARIVEDMSRTSCYGTDPRDGSATPLVASRHVASAIRQEPT